jgi:hypothetical protein
MYKGLPKLEKSFEIDMVGEETGVPYVGQFVTKCVLSIQDKQLIELQKSRMSADLANPSGRLFAISTMLSSLRVRLIETPEWWKDLDDGAKILDEEVIVQIFEQCEAKAQEWKDEVKKSSIPKEKAEGNSKKGS